MKNAKAYITGVILILAGVLVYYLWKNLFSNKYAVATPPATKGGENVQTFNKNPLSLDSFPLKNGSRGQNVILLQRALGGVIQDGIFGALTESALYKRMAKDSVTQAELDMLIKQKNPGVFLEQVSDNSINELVLDLNSEINASVILHNTYNPVWKSLLQLSEKGLKNLAESYKATYGKSLYKSISDLNFVPFQSDDNIILERLEEANQKV